MRGLVIFAGLLAIWQAVTVLTAVPPFLLPGPDRVALALLEHAGALARNAGVTGGEILAGLALGTLLGSGAAVLMAASTPARRWLLPVLVASQAAPVFALAPLLTLWFGYGLGSKIAMATLIIFFPVCAALQDGLRATPPALRDQARVMGANRWRTMRWIALPSALPALGSGLRVAAAAAPIGAVVGEWVGSSAGLGHLMLHANARVKTDLMFAALFVLALMGVALYFAIDALARRMAPWAADSAADHA